MSSLFTPSDGALRPVNMDVVIDVFSALLTPVIAAIAVYIAYQQWEINRRKLELELELYERRLRVHQAVTRFVGKVITEASLYTQDFSELSRGTAEADFLFASDVRVYRKDLNMHGAILRKWNNEYRDNQQVPAEGYDHGAVVKGIEQELKWFADQLEGARQLFAKYLNLTGRPRRPWRSILTERNHQS